MVYKCVDKVRQRPQSGFSSLQTLTRRLLRDYTQYTAARLLGVKRYFRVKMGIWHSLCKFNHTDQSMISSCIQKIEYNLIILNLILLQ